MSGLNFLTKFLDGLDYFPVEFYFRGGNLLFL